jgi:hypothetical protein
VGGGFCRSSDGALTPQIRGGYGKFFVVLHVKLEAEVPRKLDGKMEALVCCALPPMQSLSLSAVLLPLLNPVALLSTLHMSTDDPSARTFPAFCPPVQGGGGVTASC